MPVTLEAIPDSIRPVLRNNWSVTRPTARVLALLEVLQSGGTRTAYDLAARLGVDERTIRRYVVHLTDLDIPVRSVRGRYGGYRLAPGYRMPPLMLTDEEALAVLLGLIAGRRAGLVTTSVAAAESAAAKLHRVLPEALRLRLDAVLQTAQFTFRPRPVTPPAANVLFLLAEAAAQRRPVAFDYTAADGRQSRRTVHPYGIVAHSGRWYVTGPDSVSGEVRTFRLDRISGPAMLAGTFDVPDGLDPAEQFLSRLSQVPYPHEISLAVQGTAEHVRTLFPAGLATAADDTDRAGWVRVLMRAERLDWVPGVLAGLGLPFVVEQPEALRDLVRSLGERLVVSASLPPVNPAHAPARASD